MNHTYLRGDMYYAAPGREPPARDSRLCIAPRSADRGAAANVAHAFAMAIGMCLMNGYLVVKGHPCLPKRKTGREFSFLSTCFLT